jgi:hypothetical protein
MNLCAPVKNDHHFQIERPTLLQAHQAPGIPCAL